MTEAEKEAHRKQVKSALVFLGPGEVTILLMDELVKRRDDACNKESKARLRKAANRIEAALNVMVGRG